MDDLNTQNLDNVDKNLIEVISKNWGKFCSSCGAEKDLSKMKVFKKVGPAVQILSECESCNLKTLITAFPNLGMHINQLRSDANAVEFEKFMSPVTANDYLNFYNTIKKISKTSDLLKTINSKK